MGQNIQLNHFPDSCSKPNAFQLLVYHRDWLFHTLFQFLVVKRISAKDISKVFLFQVFLPNQTNESWMVVCFQNCAQNWNLIEWTVFSEKNPFSLFWGFFLPLLQLDFPSSNRKVVKNTDSILHLLFSPDEERKHFLYYLKLIYQLEDQNQTFLIPN